METSLIEKVLMTKDLVTALHDENGVLSVNWYDNGVHMDQESFFKTFNCENISISNRDDFEVPYQASVNVVGFTFYTLLNEEKFEKYISGVADDRKTG